MAEATIHYEQILSNTNRACHLILKSNLGYDVTILALPRKGESKATRQIKKNRLNSKKVPEVKSISVPVNIAVSF